MKDEIKEILGTIKKCIETNDNNIESFIIDINKWKELLDYITNLQEKVKLLTTGLEATDKAYKDYKSRCEKATKLLKQAGSYDEETKQFCDDVWEELTDILNTLEGSDK